MLSTRQWPFISLKGKVKDLRMAYMVLKDLSSLSSLTSSGTTLPLLSLLQPAQSHSSNTISASYLQVLALALLLSGVFLLYVPTSLLPLTILTEMSPSRCGPPWEHLIQNYNCVPSWHSSSPSSALFSSIALFLLINYTIYFFNLLPLSLSHSLSLTLSPSTHLPHQ